MLTVSTEIVPCDQYQSAKHSDEADEQQRRAAGIADAERAVGEVGHRGAEGGGGDDRRPIEERVKFVGDDLRDDQHDEQRRERARCRRDSPN